MARSRVGRRRFKGGRRCAAGPLRSPDPEGLKGRTPDGRDNGTRLRTSCLIFSGNLELDCDQMRSEAIRAGFIEATQVHCRPLKNALPELVFGSGFARPHDRSISLADRFNDVRRVIGCRAARSHLAWDKGEQKKRGP